MDHEIDDKRLAAAIVLLERFVRDIYPAKQSSAIQPLQWSILRYVSRMPPDRCEVRWIAKFLGLTRAPVTRAIATLEARKLIAQAVSDVDARTKTVALTPLGVGALAEDPIILTAERIRVLSAKDQEQFVKAIRSISLNFGSIDDEKH